MKISELIVELELAKARLGDIKVTVSDDGIARKPETRQLEWIRDEFCVEDGALLL